MSCVLYQDSKNLEQPCPLLNQKAYSRTVVPYVHVITHLRKCVGRERFDVQSNDGQRIQ